MWLAASLRMIPEPDAAISFPSLDECPLKHFWQRRIWFFALLYLR
jgi:hypothetical protein